MERNSVPAHGLVMQSRLSIGIFPAVVPVAPLPLEHDERVCYTHHSGRRQPPDELPQLKATANVGQLQEELTSTENRIAFARQLYNDTATQYNTRQQQFPTSVVAGIAKAQPADLWEIEDVQERAVPQVDLSMKPKV